MGSFVFVCCVVFSQGCCVFIQHNLLEGCCEWILMQPWTQVIDYLFPGLTWHIRLRIGIYHCSHLSIPRIVVHGYHMVCVFYNCLLVDLCFFWFFLFFSCILTVVWATKNPFQSFSLSFWLITKLYYYYYGSITLYYILLLNCIIVFILLYHCYLFSIVFIILFLFSFSISYCFYFHLSNPKWFCVAFTVLSRIYVIPFIIIFVIIFPARFEPKM